MDVPSPVQFMPLLEYAIVFVPKPTATHSVPFHATPRPTLEKMVVPSPVQFMPLLEYAIEFVPKPTATHNEPFHATLYP